MDHQIKIDPFQRLCVDDVIVASHVTRKEEAVLRAVLTHNQVATKDYILTVVYGGMDEPEIKIIDVFITRLRAKLGAHRGAIVTVWGRGYARGDRYVMADPEKPEVAIRVNATLLTDVSFAAGERGEDLVERLLLAERTRLWSEAA